MKCKGSLILMQLTQKLKVVYCWCEHVRHNVTMIVKIIRYILVRIIPKMKLKVQPATSAFYKTWASSILMAPLFAWPRKSSLDVWSTKSDHENNIHLCYIIDSGCLNTWELNFHCPNFKVTTTFQTSNSLILLDLKNNGKTYMTDYLVGVYQ